MSRIGEFDLITRLLKESTRGRPEALDLLDDAALLPTFPKGAVIAADALIEGVHFRADDPTDLIAQKCLRVNLSDIAAMGARADSYLLTCAWGREWDADRITSFAHGLMRDGVTFDIDLLGGDTTSHSGPAVFSVTMIGTKSDSGLVLRSGARPGDLLFVSGTIGDAGLGLRCLTSEAVIADQKSNNYLVVRYQTPQPRVALGSRLAGVATAMIDVSDGLMADAGHIASASGVRLEIEAARAPLSDAARGWMSQQLDRQAALVQLLTAGDDYELLFAAPPDKAEAVMKISEETGIAVSQVGVVRSGEGCDLLDEQGAIIPVKCAGFTHDI